MSLSSHYLLTSLGSGLFSYNPPPLIPVSTQEHLLHMQALDQRAQETNMENWLNPHCYPRCDRNYGYPVWWRTPHFGPLMPAVPECTTVQTHTAWHPHCRAQSSQTVGISSISKGVEKLFLIPSLSIELLFLYVANFQLLTLFQLSGVEWQLSVSAGNIWNL